MVAKECNCEDGRCIEEKVAVSYGAEIDALFSYALDNSDNDLVPDSQDLCQLKSYRHFIGSIITT